MNTFNELPHSNKSTFVFSTGYLDSDSEPIEFIVHEATDDSIEYLEIIANESLELIKIRNVDQILNNYKKIQKNVLSRRFLEDYQSELESKHNYITGFEDYYNQVITKVIPTVINNKPNNIGIKITVSNTLFLIVKFDNDIELKLEAFIRNMEDPNDSISFAYSFFENGARVLARFEYFERIDQTLRNDLSNILNSSSESIEVNQKTMATSIEE